MVQTPLKLKRQMTLNEKMKVIENRGLQMTKQLTEESQILDCIPTPKEMLMKSKSVFEKVTLKNSKTNSKSPNRRIN